MMSEDQARFMMTKTMHNSFLEQMDKYNRHYKKRE